MTKLVLNRDKAIGNVLYITEGKSTEFSIISQLYSCILHYKEIDISNKLHDCRCFIKNNDPFSKVFIVRCNKTNIIGINLDDNYFDDLHKLLSEEYGFDINNMSVYYIFNRNRGTNRLRDVKNAMAKYKNSRNNGTEMNGLLLLNYPTIQAFFISRLNALIYFKLASFCKLYCFGRGLNNIRLIDESSLLTIASFTINQIENITHQSFNINCLDDFAAINLSILDFEENANLHKSGYLSLSLLIMSLIDLGIIVII